MTTPTGPPYRGPRLDGRVELALVVGLWLITAALIARLLVAAI